MTETCPFCGTVYYDPDNDIPSEQYMWEGHALLECEKIPKEEREWLNKPWKR